MPAPMTSAQAAQAAYQANAYARQRVLSEAVPVIQKVATFSSSQTPYVAGQPLVLNCPLQNVGLIKRVWLKVTANVQQSAAETHTKTVLGPANFLSSVVYSDMSNLIRINTTGWHLHMLSTAKRQLAFGSAFTQDNPCGIGSNYNIIKQPSPVTGAANLYMMYEVPFAYSDADLRGAIFASTVAATQNLQMTINPNVFVASGADATLACYSSSVATLGKINSWQIDVYQEFLDQLPRDPNNNYVLPMLDLAQQYTLLSNTYTGLAANTAYSIPFGNLRNYLSAFVIYDNGGTLNAGTDITQFTLQSANQMNMLQMDPFVSQLVNGRNKINGDWPVGMYYFPFRDRPLNTNATGNTLLNVTPSAVNANAMLQCAFEFFASQTQLASAAAVASM